MLLFVIVMGVLGSLFTIREWWWLYAARHLGLHVHHPGRRGIRADGDPEGRALRDAGTRLRVRAGVRGVGRADHGVHHRAARAVLDHPVHELRGRRSRPGAGCSARAKRAASRSSSCSRAWSWSCSPPRVHDARVPARCRPSTRRRPSVARGRTHAPEADVPPRADSRSVRAADSCRRLDDGPHLLLERLEEHRQRELVVQHRVGVALRQRRRGPRPADRAPTSTPGAASASTRTSSYAASQCAILGRSIECQ